ncbi:surface lipoprotein assembly modifier [uncultured Litoreibacter sp.]|uniref:surface lipoprotein assembly modifier n=1 Tax=uncultured Litoreibacter sp. TaxID=1392394 RepID=UPI0026142EE9|nr:surface lipoprotein assembly modifier [uncultured Litoreibacter sp.]
MLNKTILEVARGALLLTLPFLFATDASGQSSRGEITVVESRSLAFSLVSQGQPVPARAIALALLKRDPNDIKALLVLSRAERLMGNLKDAKRAGKRAWKTADSSGHKFTAAMLTAQAVSSMDNKLSAQIWLRRAAQVAPNEKLKASAVRDLRFVRGSSPVSLNFDISVAPSSNINNGSKSEFIEIAGLPFALSGDAQALSGIEYAFGSTFSYKLPTQNDWNLTAGLSLSSRFYTLSSSAKALAPDVSGSDYAFQEVTASLVASKQDRDRKGATSLHVKAGHNWYGGSSLSQFVELGASRQLRVGKRSSLGFNLGLQRQWRQDSDLRSSDVTNLSVTWAHALNGGGAIWVTGYASDTASESAAIAHGNYGATIRYTPAKPLFADTNLELAMGYSEKEFDRAQFPFSRREDKTVDASIKVIFNDLNYMGFAPTAELNAKQTSSTLDQFSLEDIGVKLGLRSTF